MENQIEKTYEIFLRTKPVKMLVFLNKKDKKRYASILSKEVDCTYSHTVRTLAQFETMGLINFDKKGRLNEIALTEKGKELAGSFEKVLKLLEK